MAIRYIEGEQRVQIEPQEGEVYIGRHLVRVKDGKGFKALDVVAMEIDKIQDNRVVTRLQGLMDDPNTPYVKDCYVYRFSLDEFRSGRAGIYTLFTPEGIDLGTLQQRLSNKQV